MFTRKLVASIEIMGEINSKLGKAEEEFRSHWREAKGKGWIVPEKGYAIVAYITPKKVFFIWKEVKPED